MIFALHDGDGVTIDEFETCFSVLDDRGSDGKASIVDRTIAVGCQHFRPDSEKAVCPQPLDDGDYIVAFDGRIDNRSALAQQFSRIEPDSADVKIFKALFQSRQERAFQDIIGPFFALVYQKSTGELVCGRDTIGLRHIFYHHSNDRLLVASSPDAILETVATTPDTAAIAGYLSQNSKYKGYTFFEEIDTLDRGSFLRYNGEVAEEHSYHVFTSPSDYTQPCPDTFRETLRKAVCARTPGADRPAVALSGGRDSNTIAALLVTDCDVAPRTYSHVSENGVESERIATEMENIERMADTYPFDSHQITIDEYDFEYDSCLDAYSFGLPLLDPYLSMQIQLYQQASDSGSILLDGFGGNCFDGTGFYYHDLLRNGQLRRLLTRSYRDDGATVANLLSSVLPVVARVTSTVTASYDPAWVQFDPPSSDVAMDVHSLEKRLMLRFLLKRSKNLMRFQARHAARKHGVDLRFPLMDERLHHEVLKMPPGSLRSGGRIKGLFLDAVDGLLPAEIEEFEVGMSFDPFLEQGLDNYGRTSIANGLDSLRTSQLGVVDEDAVRPEITAYLSESDRDGLKPIYLWKLLTVERWLDRHGEQNTHATGT